MPSWKGLLRVGGEKLVYERDPQPQGIRTQGLSNYWGLLVATLTGLRATGQRNIKRFTQRECILQVKGGAIQNFLREEIETALQRLVHKEKPTKESLPKSEGKLENR